MTSLKNPMVGSERYTYNYFLQDNICRLCWGTDGFIELTARFPIKSFKNDATIAQKIQECVGIDVSMHSCPKKVCSTCLKKLKMFTQFKKFCLETDKKLHDILQSGPLEKIKPLKEEKEEKFEVSVVKQELDSAFSDTELSDVFSADLPTESDQPKQSNTFKDEKKHVTRNKCIKKKMYYCKSCNIHVDSVERLTAHKECHGIEQNGYFKCFGCHKLFKYPSQRLRHETVLCEVLKPGYKCNICDRYLPERKVFDSHMIAHRENKDILIPEGINKCDQCGKPFENVNSLREHMVTHFEKKTFICEVCGRVFNHKNNMEAHKLTHEGIKPLKCPHCDYRTVHQVSLGYHIRTHTGERPYQCDMCPHRSVNRSNLIAHRKGHLGIKDHECKLCDKQYRCKRALEEHMSIVHDQTSEKLTCTQCGSTYSRVRGLRRHMLAKHGKKLKKNKDGLEISSVEMEVGT